MKRILQSTWFTAAIGGVLYLLVTFLVLNSAKFENVAAATHAETEPKTLPPDNNPSWKFQNPEFEQWVTELKREKEALELRAQQLQELALRIEAERNELTSITQMVAQLQAEFDKNVLRIQEQEADNLKRQAKVFANMSSDAVAALISEMAEDEAVKILYLMKNDDVSAILETLSRMGKVESRRAASITEKIRRTLPPPKSKAS
jgi:Mg/Co/Ni transporter MgtE (contains CBS domain)